MPGSTSDQGSQTGAGRRSPTEELRDGGTLAGLQAARDAPEDEQFLAELSALDEHRKVYQERHPSARLDRDDPDVSRMIDALAFFSLRTRQTTLRNVRSTFERLFRNYFDFLLTPLPSMCMLQAQATAQRAEPALLPRGSELLVTTPNGAAGTYRTLYDLRILPLVLRRVRQPLMRADGGYRLIIEFQAPSTRLMQVGTLRLHVNYLDDYPTALRIVHQMRVHLERVQIVYDRSADEETSGDACNVTYGVQREVTDNLDTTHPIEHVRRFFHFPEQDLYINVQVPPVQKPWLKFSLLLDLKSTWPRKPHLNNDVFQLFTVPAVNIRREMAQPIVCDGTQDAYAVRHASPGRTFELCALKGVYEITAQGLEALPAGNLPIADSGSRTGTASLGAASSSQDVWEIEWRPDERGHQQPFLLVRMPGAFLQPRKLVVDAFWYQPWFTQHAIGNLQVSLQSRHLEAVDWSMLGGVRPERKSPLREDFAGLLQLLALKMRATLGRLEILSLCQYLGTLSDGPFKLLPSYLLDVRVDLMPDSALRGAGIKHVYKIKTRNYPPEDEPLVWMFLSQLMRILDSWNQDADVELEIDTSNAPLTRPVLFK